MEDSELTWPELLQRLKRDLESRAHTPGQLKGEADENAWQVAYERILALAPSASNPASTEASDEVRDVVHEVVLKLQSLKILTLVIGADLPQAYISRMIRNAAADRARQQDKDRIAREDLERQFSGISAHGERDSAEVSLSRVRSLIHALPARDQALLRMKFWENLSISQIASLLGVKYSTVATRTFRLLRRLKRELSDDR